MKQPTLNRFVAAMLSYIVLLLLAIYAVRLGWLPGWERLLSLLPLIPGIMVVLTVVRAMQDMDELEQRIQLEALGIGFGGLFLLLLTETLQGIVIDNPAAPGLYILYMAALWMVGLVAARRRYQA